MSDTQSVGTGSTETRSSGTTSADTRAIYSRITRRETTSPRSTLAIVLAVIVILACLYAIVETFLSLTNEAALVAAPEDMGTALVNVPAYPAGVMIAAGILAAIIGLILIVVALKTGRRARHVLQTERTATVVDDEVVASALARHAAYEGNVDPDRARVSVSRHRAVVRLVPASGTSVPTPPITDVVTEQLNSYGLKPNISAKVIVEKGKVGA